MLGDSYGAQDAQIDLARNALNAITAGVGKGLEPGISGVLGIAAKEKRQDPAHLPGGLPEEPASPTASPT